MVLLSIWKNFIGTQKRVGISQGKHQCSSHWDFTVTRHPNIHVGNKPVQRIEVEESTRHKWLKWYMYLLLFCLALSIKKVELGIRTGQPCISIMWPGQISFHVARGMMFQWGSTLKVSNELPATTRCRWDITGRFLKVTYKLQPNKQRTCYGGILEDDYRIIFNSSP